MTKITCLKNFIKLKKMFSARFCVQKRSGPEALNGEDKISCLVSNIPREQAVQTQDQRNPVAEPQVCRRASTARVFIRADAQSGSDSRRPAQLHQST